MLNCRTRVVLGAVAAVAATEAVLVHLGRTYGSTPQERARVLPGDCVVADPQVVTIHATTIDAPPDSVWPWLVQMGWGRGGWYTARWVDRLLFPNNGPSATRVVVDWQQLEVGDFIPDGPPAAACGFIVEHLEPERVLVLHSTSHLPARWRSRAQLDWSWVFVVDPLDGAAGSRFLVRSRWRTAPRWLTIGARFGIVPADFVMARSMLHGVKARAERLARAGPPAERRSDSSTPHLTRVGQYLGLAVFLRRCVCTRLPSNRWHWTGWLR